MRVQILTQYFTPEVTAASLRLQQLCDELVRRGHDVDVVTAMPNHPEGAIFPAYRGRFLVRERVDGVTIRRVWIHAATGRGLRRVFNYISFAALAPVAMMRTKRPAVVLVETPPLLAFVPALLDRLIRRRRFALLIADLYPDTAIDMGMLNNRLAQQLLLRVERWGYRWATLVAPVTEGQVATLRATKGVPADRIHLVPNGVDIDLFRPGEPRPDVRQLLCPNDERVVMFAGTVGYAQNVDVILDAVPAVREAHPDVRFVFVGAGSDWERVAERVASERIDGVAMLPPVPPAELAEYYKCVTAGITSIRRTRVSEAARPSKIFPMMSSELPVIYAGAGEGERIVTSAGAGVSAHPGDARALAEVITKLLDSPERVRELGRSGRRLVEAEFSWSRIMRDFVAELEHRVGQDRP